MNEQLKEFQEFCRNLKTKTSSKVDIPKDIADFHEEVANFACFVMSVSQKKYTNSNVNVLSRKAFILSQVWQISLHCSISCLCIHGWAQTTPNLLRTMLDNLANLIVITETEDDCEYMAFRYHFHDILKSYCNKNSSREDKTLYDHLLQEAPKILSKTCLERIKAFVKRKKIGNFWYNPEYSGPSKVLAKYNPTLAKFYKIFSDPVHGKYTELFLDRPRRYVYPSQSECPGSINAILVSSIILFDTTLLQNNFEDLGLKEILDELFKKRRILSKKYIPGSE